MKLIYLLFTGILFICVLPLQIVVAVIILLLYGWPVLFLQQRIGKNGTPFIMYKFRTMIRGAHTMQRRYMVLNESSGPAFKIRHDPRFTRFGRFLSHTGLDELPQFFNVLKGEMSFIGPRPLPSNEAKKLAPWMHKREQVLPGIISPAILTGSYHRDFRAWMQQDVAYVHTKHPYKDVVLCISAIPFMARMFIQSILGR